MKVPNKTNYDKYAQELLALEIEEINISKLN